MTQLIFRLVLPLKFPDGISAGEGRNGNHRSIARDGSGAPVLRGTALAGALRHGWMKLYGLDQECAEKWFGRALDDKIGVESPLRVPDCLLDIGQGDDMLKRTHIAIDRHRGSVVNGGLFTLDSLPPGTTTSACVWLYVNKTIHNDPKKFLSQLVAVFEAGLTLGGNAARGIGRAVLRSKADLKQFDCSDLDQHAAFLDEQYGLGQGIVPATDNPLEPDLVEDHNLLKVEICLGIPRGEDLLIADGQGVDYEMEPQRVKCADGQVGWRIPGSSLKGVLRGWFTRLEARAAARREGPPVADSLGSWRKHNGKINGDMLAHGYDEEPVRTETRRILEEDSEKLDERVLCPIMRLFGSAYSKSRIHVSDAISIQLESKEDRQMRTHVAVDRITGGAQEGALFTNIVLTGAQRYSCMITIQSPTEQEVQWLLSALRAIDIGIVRIGSSKAGGWLKLVCKPIATGAHGEHINKMTVEEML